MLKLYTTNSCTSCRKARRWLVDHDIPFEEKNFGTTPITLDELKNILILTEEGTEDIISIRSKVFQKLDIDINELPLHVLLELVQDNPSLLRRPIMIDEKRLQIGFNEDEIRCFLPRSVRKRELSQTLLLSGL
ncbi:spx/MgsR family transcriptional regulator [Enterococcus moraviensis ATCC BAA-383]|uniref:Regulatory protein Spx n=1 Tax=Enterococcus moraviensis ATCC BAA-383 TaxID=1158609 RepID=R2TXH3_9ENTE|nr:transcriptional regulator SpxA [Enterococcus moraviensis]EOI05037.1 spx/MgsR family transcriptional regulator [Enterococcus moraviensis ATCC BAA-383]EOT63820.1 regulatory protein Spx [Enterococcus moraviensis ATCC BAA-383]OJG67048.1 spx/MgsR family transcriptional regulator [Enterococcus moraviensis]